jgi:hypothetical protein
MNSLGQFESGSYGEINGKKKVMKTELIIMVEKFPGLKEKITSLYEQNENFQALCSDYFLCLRSLHQWEENIKRDASFIKEYQELKSALESELLSFIEKT